MRHSMRANGEVLFRVRREPCVSALGIDAAQQFDDLRHAGGAGGAELVDDNAGGDVRNLDGFAHSGTAGERSSEVGCDRIARAYDVDLATQRQSRDMRWLAIG